MAKFSDAKSGAYCTCTREKCSDECKTYRRFRPKPITNADTVRAMSDEELAVWINHMQADAYGRGIMEMDIVNYPNTYSKWIDWLRKDVQT